MTLQRIEFNVTTGERKVIDLTPTEVADAEARTTAEAAKPKPRREPTVRDLMRALKAKGIEITDADLSA